MFTRYKKFRESWERVGVEDPHCLLGRIDDFAENNMEGKSTATDSPSMAANGSNFPNETGGNQHQSATELPPPYSAVPQYRVENAAVIRNPSAPQQNNTWYPHQGMNSSHPPFSYPGGNQPSPGYFTYNPTAAPSRPGVQLSEEEGRRRQEAAIRHGIAASVVRRPFGGRRSCTYRLIRLGIMLFILGVTLLVVLGVLLVRPALNDTQLKSARCKVISSVMTGDYMSCDCGRYCSSKYPCLVIRVSYDADGKKNTAYLYKDVFAHNNKVRIVFYYSTKLYVIYIHLVIESYTCVRYFF